MTTKVWGEEYRTILVCIDAYRDGVPQGRFYNPYLSKGRTFSNLMRFIQGIENTLDQMDYPRAFSAIRTFAAPATLPDSPCVETHMYTGQLATFAVRILFRQNASWQGSVIWQEGRQEQTFRSVLELVLLMDSALTCKEM